MILPRRFHTDGIPPVKAVSDICSLPMSRFSYSKERVFTGDPRCFDFSADGAFFGIGVAGEKQIFSLTLTTPFEVDKMVFHGAYNVDNGPDNIEDVFGIRYNNDGTQVWVSGSTGIQIGNIISYTLSNPYLFNETTDAPVRLGANPTNTGGAILHVEDLNIKPDGTRVLCWGNDSGRDLHQFDMTAWDVTTMDAGTHIEESADACFVPPGGNCLYRNGGSGIIHKLGFSTSWDGSTLGAAVQETLDVTPQLDTDLIEALYVTENRLYVLSDAGVLYQYNA